MNDSHSTRVVLLDGHSFVRTGLQQSLRDAGMRVVGEADDAAVVTAIIGREHPDVTVVETALPNGDVTDRIAGWAQHTRVLVLSGFAARASRALACGAHGFALKSERIGHIVDAVRTVARGARYLSPALSSTYRAQVDPLEELTAREQEVFELVIEGFSTDAVALKLGIAAKTVESHRARINRKLDAHCAADLIRFAALRGLLRERHADADRGDRGDRGRSAGVVA
jgi:DNA-binding NarL/FixJ family response regulator